MQKFLLPSVVAALLVLLAAPSWSQDAPGGQEMPVDLNAPGRQAEDVARDKWSKPLEVFTWLEVEPGDVIVDFHAGSGYNTWILSQWVGPEGVVYTESPDRYAEEIQTRLESGDLKDAGNVVYVPGIEDLPDDGLDLFFISRNYHDVPAEEIPAFLAEVRRTLKPGGIFAVIDARTPEGRDEEAHRIADAVIIEETTAAGLELVESSELLANPEDDHVGPQWDRREQLDQSLLKFREPAAETEPAGDSPDPTGR
ncbi:MAG TPA: methyltransferase domain-containing protein [Gemmatimonadota bacterium]|nr:methyltransferase domain-containing protein [Gemmatimonadota bacterium]